MKYFIPVFLALCVSASAQLSITPAGGSVNLASPGPIGGTTSSTIKSTQFTGPIGDGFNLNYGGFSSVEVLNQTSLYGQTSTFGDTILGDSASDSVLIGTSARLSNEAAGVLALQNGVNYHPAIRLYEDYTGASNYEVARMEWGGDGADFYIGTGRAGTGVSRALAFITGDVVRWRVEAAGHLLTPLDNTYDIGAIGASRPRHAYFGGDVVAGGAVTIGGGTAITKSLSSTATLEFPPTAGLVSADMTIIVTNAVVGNVVDIGVPAASVPLNGSFFAWVSAANTVTVRYLPLVAGDPLSGIFRAMVWQH